MLTRKIRNQIDQVWGIFWSSDVANPISIIDNIFYLPFILRLDELQHIAERKTQATRLHLADEVSDQAVPR